MKRYSLYLFDLDGTIYRGGQAIEHAAESVHALVAGGAMVRYLTNNSGATAEFVHEKLVRMGLPCEPSWVFGTAALAGKVCAERGYGRVFVVGESSLHQAMRDAGVEEAGEEGPCDAVVAGVCRSLSYALLAAAMRHVRAGAKFIATNRDATYPLEGDRMEPGAGAIVAALETCSGVKPEVLGKPNPLMVEKLLAETGVPKSETVMVGDRVETDLECGLQAGVDAWLVLTGVTKVAPNGQPHGADLRDLLR